MKKLLYTIQFFIIFFYNYFFSRCNSYGNCHLCEEGYRLTESNTCETCTVDYCDECTSNKSECTKCRDSYKLNNTK